VWTGFGERARRAERERVVDIAEDVAAGQVGCAAVAQGDGREARRCRGGINDRSGNTNLP